MTGQRAFAERIYDPRGASYDESHHPEFASRMVKHAHLQPGEHVLDLACGTGLVTFDAAEKVGPHGSVVGLDVSNGMLAVAEAKKSELPQLSANIELYLHDVADLDSLEQLKGRQFDCILMCSALVLIDDPVACVTGVSKYAKPGGRFIVDVVTPKTLPIGLALERTGKQLGVAIGHNTSWSESADSVRAILERSGFDVQGVESHHQTNTPRTFDVDDADLIFEEQTKNPAFEALRHPRVIEQARTDFHEILTDMADKGVIKEENAAWVATAVRPSVKDILRK